MQKPLQNARVTVLIFKTMPPACKDFEAAKLLPDCRHEIR